MQYDCARAIEVKKISSNIIRKTFSDSYRKGLSPEQWRKEMLNEVTMMKFAEAAISVPKVLDVQEYSYDMTYCGEPLGELTFNQFLRIKNTERDLIHKANIYHNDIKPSNILFDGEKITFIDFGHATKSKANFPFFNHLHLVELDDNAKNTLQKNIVEFASNSRSHGGGKPYYGIDGELGVRMWEKRWNILKDAFDYNDSRVLDLGCNQGVFTSSIAENFSPAFVLGVDATPEILLAANYYAAINEVVSYFKQLNIADGDKRNKKYLSDTNWKDELGYDWDFVSALSLYHWVQDKEDLLNYLSKFPRVLIECHNDKELQEIKSYFISKGYSFKLLHSGSNEFADRPLIKFFFE